MRLDYYQVECEDFISFYFIYLSHNDRNTNNVRQVEKENRRGDLQKLQEAYEPQISSNFSIPSSLKNGVCMHEY